MRLAVIQRHTNVCVDQHTAHESYQLWHQDNNLVCVVNSMPHHRSTVHISWYCVPPCLVLICLYRPLCLWLIRGRLTSICCGHLDKLQGPLPYDILIWKSLLFSGTEKTFNNPCDINNIIFSCWFVYNLQEYPCDVSHYTNCLATSVHLYLPSKHEYTSNAWLRVMCHTSVLLDITQQLPDWRICPHKS